MYAERRPELTCHSANCPPGKNFGGGEEVGRGEDVGGGEEVGRGVDVGGGAEASNSSSTRWQSRLSSGRGRACARRTCTECL